MPVLMIRISSNNENITISKELRAQKMTLVRATIYKNATGGGQSYRGSLFFDLDFFNGFEYITNLNDNFLVAPVSDENNQSLQTYEMNQDFNSEDIRQSFNIKTLYRDGSGNYLPVPFDPTGSNAGEIIYVDLFFQVSQLFDYSGY